MDRVPIFSASSPATCRPVPTSPPGSVARPRERPLGARGRTCCADAAHEQFASMPIVYDAAFRHYRHAPGPRRPGAAQRSSRDKLGSAALSADPEPARRGVCVETGWAPRRPALRECGRLGAEPWRGHARARRPPSRRAPGRGNLGGGTVLDLEPSQRGLHCGPTCESMLTMTGGGDPTRTGTAARSSAARARRATAGVPVGRAPGRLRDDARRPASRSRSDAVSVSRAVAGLVDSSRRRWASPVLQDRLSSAKKDGRSVSKIINDESKE
jgi:hypothetical protein